jgi:hypothetical protein
MSSKRQLGVGIVMLWALAVTVGRSVRLPNDFAEAHWLLDYRFGFVARGLLGTLMSLLSGCAGARPTETLIATVAVGAFSACCLVLLVVGLRIVQRSCWSSAAILAALVFLTSPFIVMSAHLVGYYDNIVIMLTAGSVFLLMRDKVWLAGCLQAVSVLVHENSMLIGLPVFCLAWFVRRHQKEALGAGRLSAAPLMLPVAAFLALAISQALFVPAGFEQSFARRLSEFGFVRCGRDAMVPRWFAASFIEKFEAHRGLALAHLSVSEMHGLVWPSLFGMLCYLLGTYNFRDISVESLAALGVCLLPLALHWIAWDVGRIWVYTILGTFILIWVYAELFPGRHYRAPGVRLLLLSALVLNVLVVTPLMDGAAECLSLNERLLFYAPVLVAAALLVALEDCGATKAPDFTRRCGSVD